MTYYNPPPPVVSRTGDQPYAGNQLPPSVEAVPVNNPVPNVDGVANIASIMAVWNPPLQHDFIAGGRQAYEPRKLAPSLTAVRVDAPPPNMDAVANINEVIGLSWVPSDPSPTLTKKFVFPGITVAGVPFSRINLNAAIVASWVPPDPVPYQPHILPPSVTAVRVDAPQPNVDALAAAMTAILSWQPPDPPPTLPRSIPPIAAVVVANGPYANLWLVTVLQSWVPADGAPTLPRNLSPGIPGQSVDNPSEPPLGFYINVTDDGIPQRARFLPQGARIDNPVPNSDALSNLMASITASWQPPDPLPVQLKKLAPGIPGLSVDNPPAFVRRQVDFPQDAALPQQSRFVPQSAVISINGPHANFWMLTVLQSWVPPDPQPMTPKNMSAGIPGQSVDNPPAALGFGVFITDADPLPQQARALPQGVTVSVRQPFSNFWVPSVIQAWQPPDPAPTLPRTVNPSITAVRVDNPPFTHAGRLPWGNLTDWSWVPPDPQPQAPGKLSPGITGSTVNNPPFTHYGRLAQTNAIIWQWQPPDPQPVQRGPLPPSLTAVRVDNPPFGVPQLWTTVILNSWQPSDALPILLRPLAPQPLTITYVPFVRAWLPSVVAAWQADPILLPTTQRQLSPGIPGQSVDVPVTARRAPVQAPDDQSLPFLRRLLVQPFVPPVPGVPYAPAWLPSVVLSWAPPDPLPTLTRNKLSPAITAVPVNNPPFPGAKTPLSVSIGWLPPQPMPIFGITMAPPSGPLRYILRFDPNFLTRPLSFPRARNTLWWGRNSSTKPMVPGMPRGNDFSAIDPTETVNGSWDFAPWLPSGVTIGSIVSTSCTVIAGTDAGAATRLIGAASIIASPYTGAAASAVLQQWGTMLAGVVYKMTATILTSDGQTLTLYAHQPCQAAG